MKKTLLFSAVVFMAIFSCKKKDPQHFAPNTTTTTTGSSTSGSTTGGTVGTPTNATTYHGIFNTGESSVSLSGFSFSSPNAMAYFSSSAVAQQNTGTGVSVGEIKFNNTAMQYDSGGIYAHPDPFSLNLSQETWAVSGANGIPSFTLTSTLAKPTGLKASSLPTSFKKSQGLNINLGTLSNVKMGQIIISDGSTNITGTVILPLINGTNVIKLTANQLSGFQEANPEAAIGVMIENSHVLNIQGKNFRFNKQVAIVKGLSIEQ